MTDRLFINGNFLTLTPTLPRCRWVAVKDGIIRYLGTGSVPQAFQAAAIDIVDLRGKTVLPGFIDPHLHFRALAESLATPSLDPKDGVRSIADITGIIRSAAKRSQPGKWLRASGYNEVYLAEERHPDRRDLDEAAPQHPVKLTHRSGNAHVLNSLGLAIAGIDSRTDDPVGGIIERHYETGDPTGVLWGLNDYLSARISDIDDKQLSHGVSLANEELLSHGITSFQDASPRNGRKRWKWFEDLKDSACLRPRVAMMVGWDGFEQLKEGRFGSWASENRLCIRGVKIKLDETSGALHPDLDTLKKRVLDIHLSGYQAIIHAIEPPAIDAAAEAIAHALNNDPRSDHRHRIEHASVCPPDLMAKLSRLGVMVTSHPAFIYASGDRYLKTVPDDQLPYLHPIASFINAGIGVSAASDAPIAGTNPMTALYSAVTRRSETGKPVLAEEGIALDLALQLFTRMPAAAMRQEDRKGTIVLEKLADLVVLSENPFEVPESKIRDIDIAMTIIGGDIVWRAEM